MRPLKNPLLRRYWIEFDVAPPNQPPAGAIQHDGDYPWWMERCGVTAYSLDDALELVRQQLWKCEATLPPIRKVIEDVDVSTLEDRYVLTHMGPPIWRGVWFPNMVL
jgi:hypothetical protein